MQIEHPFHFNCHRRGNCCRVGRGHVWIDEQDVDVMAEVKQMTSASFLQGFVYGTDGRLAFREEPNGAHVAVDDDAAQQG
ncbi:MAG TPA: hypothetical protein EYN86_06855 [Planctomycetes bacterium]|nr:hypothetical protein [Planctomycetota bacterium]